MGQDRSTEHLRLVKDNQLLQIMPSIMKIIGTAVCVGLLIAIPYSPFVWQCIATNSITSMFIDVLVHVLGNIAIQKELLFIVVLVLHSEVQSILSHQRKLNQSCLFRVFALNGIYYRVHELTAATWHALMYIASQLGVSQPCG